MPEADIPEPEKNSYWHRLREVLRILRKHRIRKGITPQKLPLILQDLGPAFVKIGQIVSMRPDILPEQYGKELAKLRTDVAPMGFAEVQAVLSEYGEPLKQVAMAIEEAPIGSASIAQVHLATLPDGSVVVVKVVRPGVREAMARDIMLLKRTVKLLGWIPGINDTIDLNAMLDEILAVAKQETDLRIEAANTVEFGRNAEQTVYVQCPKIIAAFEKVLVMEHIVGIPINHTDELTASGYDLDEIAEKLSTYFIRQVVQDGFFHADPHPGNLLIREGKIVWIDLGMMGRIGALEKEMIMGAMSAIAANDAAQMASYLSRMCTGGDNVDRGAFDLDLEKFAVKYSQLDFQDLDIKVLIYDLLAVLRAHHMGLPNNVSMLIRGMITMEGTIRFLNPRLNMAQNISSYLKTDFLSAFTSPEAIQKAALSLYRSLQQGIELPNQASEVMRKLLQGSIKTQREVNISRATMAWIEKLFNRLLAILALLVFFVGASLIFWLDLPPRVFGVPLFGILGYLATFLLIAWLVALTFFKKR